MARKAKDETGNGTSIHRNGFDPEKAKGFLRRALDLHANLATLTGEHMERCKRVRESLDHLYDEATNAGIRKKAMKGHVKRELLELKIDSIREGLDGDDQDAYDNLDQALGGLRDLPLGQHALAAAAAG